MSIKIRCRFRKCGQGGGRGWLRGEEGPLGRRTRGPPSPRAPHPLPNALFFRRMDGWCGAADCAPLMVPRYCGRGQWKIWRDARYFRGMQGVGHLWSGDGKRTADVPRCAVLFRHAVWPSAGQGREALSGFVCGLFEGWRNTRRRGDFPPETAGGGRRAMPVMTRSLRASAARWRPLPLW